MSHARINRKRLGLITNTRMKGTEESLVRKFASRKPTMLPLTEGTMIGIAGSRSAVLEFLGIENKRLKYHDPNIVGGAVVYRTLKLIGKGWRYYIYATEHLTRKEVGLLIKGKRLSNKISPDHVSKIQAVEIAVYDKKTNEWVEVNWYALGSNPERIMDARSVEINGEVDVTPVGTLKCVLDDDETTQRINVSGTLPRIPMDEMEAKVIDVVRKNYGTMTTTEVKFLGAVETKLRVNNQDVSIGFVDENTIFLGYKYMDKSMMSKRINVSDDQKEQGTMINDGIHTYKAVVNAVPLYEMTTQGIGGNGNTKFLVVVNVFTDRGMPFAHLVFGAK